MSSSLLFDRPVDCVANSILLMIYQTVNFESAHFFSNFTEDTLPQKINTPRENTQITFKVNEDDELSQCRDLVASQLAPERPCLGVHSCALRVTRKGSSTFISCDLNKARDRSIYLVRTVEIKRGNE